ncbi:TetR/AcrR family transcriptional regulator [Phytoactinopolyspora halotolerans]|uniref:TetR/AcrR family transcriptional regulator n=1 Tax=Phytoactinopolyspora halotolerans TaxID=1981512 RepID=A0A6L9SD24_9ACTN|nr:TetR/AcrR family transcriptional regulator [Phytoactinopolyspora halotolerans]NEE02987.1 TetR/AcrR family transcriptional regulator [Phytoactinopolyspora halotolerans]
MASTRGFRQRVRDELTREIKDVARRQLAQVGAGGLSVRAVTRELGMASSAVYRYFPSRDALLTALITDAYVGLGQAARRAESQVAREDHLGRWKAVFRSVREWAREHPHEYALVYGSPVPGYAAPEHTAIPAGEVVILLAQIAIEAAVARRTGTPGDDPVTDALATDVEILKTHPAVSQDDEIAAALAEMPASGVLHVLDAWTMLFGAVSFELFGHYADVLTSLDDYLDRLATKSAAPLGLTHQHS